MHLMYPTPDISGVKMLPSSHKCVRLPSLRWRKSIQQEKGMVCRAVVFLYLEKKLLSVFKRSIFQPSRGRCLKKFMGEAQRTPVGLHCCRYKKLLNAF